MISKNIIHVYSGNIRVESKVKPGKGSTFRFNLTIKSAKDINVNPSMKSLNFGLRDELHGCFFKTLQVFSSPGEKPRHKQ